MAQVHCLTFNPFQQNTYIVYDETGECVILDPGCFDERERRQLRQFIDDNRLRPVRLLNTHCHLDHVFGNAFVAQHYGLGLEIHAKELSVLASFPMVAQMYNVRPVQQSPEPSNFLEADSVLTFGNTELKILFTPGHSPGSICFYNERDAFIIVGDVLFESSIGRTDLPGGHYKTLMNSIFDQLLPLPDAVTVYSGHGNPTTIGQERKTNPFILDEQAYRMNL